MFVTKLKAATLGLAVVLLTAGLGLLAHCAVAAKPEPGGRSSTAVQPTRSDGKGAALEGLWADLASNDDGKVARATLTLAANARESIPFLKEHLFPVTSNPARLARLIGELDSSEYPRRQKATEELEYLGTRAVPALRKALAAGPALEPRRRIELVLRKIETGSATDRHKLKLELDAARTKLARHDAEAEDRALQEKVAKMKAEQAMARAALEKLKGNEKKVAEQKLIVLELEVLLTELRSKEGRQMEAVEAYRRAIELRPPGTAPEVPSVWWVRTVRAIAILESIGTPEARQLLEHLGSGDADVLPTREAKAALARLDKRTAP